MCYFYVVSGEKIDVIKLLYRKFNMSWSKEYLEKAFLEMDKKNPLYKSTSFWEEACRKISKNISDKGFSDFRNERYNLSFFVPTYGYPGNSFSQDGLQGILELFPKET